MDGAIGAYWYTLNNALIYHVVPSISEMTNVSACLQALFEKYNFTVNYPSGASAYF